MSKASRLQKKTCEHQWITYFETIRRERTPAEEKRTADPLKVPLMAVFKTQECSGCHIKVRVDYQVNAGQLPDGADVREFEL